MQSNLSEIVCWVLALLAVTVSHAAAQDGAMKNMITNPGFETTGEWSDNWQWAKVDSHLRIITDPAAAFSGSGCLEVVCRKYNTGATQFHSNIFAIQKGQAYRVRFHHRGERVAKVRVQIRKVAPPWTEYGKIEVTPVQEWNQGEFLIVASDSVDATALYFSFEGEGTLWIDDVSVTPVSLPKVQPQKTGNLIPNASFELPLGYHDWRTQLDGPHELVSSNAPHGQRSLLVKNASAPLKWGQVRGNLLRSGVIKVRPFCDHVLAADLRSDHPAKITLQVHGDGLALFEQTFDIGPEWNRVSVTGNTQTAERVSVRVLSDRGFQIDGVYLGEGTTAPAEFETRASVEASIHVTPAPSKLFVHGEPITLSLAAAAGDRAKPLPYQLWIEHWDGQKQSLPGGTIPADGEPISVSITPERNGPQRIFLQVEGGPVAMNAFGVLPRRTASPTPDSPFGAHVGFDDAAMVDLTRKLGIAWQRAHWPVGLTQWRAVEPKRGEWVFRDQVLERYEQNNIKTLGILQSTPDWAAEGKTMSMGKSLYSMAHPNDVNDWRNYARTVAARYPQIEYWELFNEPNVGTFWPGTPDELMELARLGVEGVRESNPNAKFVMPGYPGLEKLKAAGVLQHAYALSEHWYAHGSTVDARVDQIRQWVQNIQAKLRSLDAGHVEIWNTEFGPGNWGGQLTSNEEDRRRAVEYFAKHIPSQMAFGVKKFFPYLMRYGVTTDGHLSIENDGTPSTGLIAYGAMIHLLEKAEAVGELNLPDANVRAYQFKRGNETLVFAWLLDAKAPKSLGRLDAQVKATDIFSNPLAGEVRLTDIPVVLTGPEAAVIDALKK